MLRVLIREDDHRYRHMLCTMLRDLGCEPSASGSAIDALAWLVEHPIDAAVLDLNMPGMDGLAFLEKWRQRDATTPVIVLTGVGTLTAAQQAIRHGPPLSDFLTKPCHLGDMERSLDRARRLLARRQSAEMSRGRDVEGPAASAPSPDVAQPPGSLRDSPARSAVQPNTLEAMEREAILAALHRCNNNKSAAARSLGISRRTLHYRLADYRRTGALP